MNYEERKKYEVPPDPFWQNTWAYGDGYDVMERAESKRHGWWAIAGWSKDGFDLGSWPYVIVFTRKREERYEVVLYVEGDITAYAAPSEEIRNAILDGIAFFYWKQRNEEWVRGYRSVEQLPDELRGPYRNS